MALSGQSSLGVVRGPRGWRRAALISMQSVLMALSGRINRARARQLLDQGGQQWRSASSGFVAF